MGDCIEVQSERNNNCKASKEGRKALCTWSRPSSSSSSSQGHPPLRKLLRERKRLATRKLFLIHSSCLVVVVSYRAASSFAAAVFARLSLSPPRLALLPASRGWCAGRRQ